MADGKYLDLELWDLPSSQNQITSTNVQHFRKAVGAVIVFDVTKRATFNNCIKWINLIKETAEPYCQIILFGNKTDLCKNEIPDE